MLCMDAKDREIQRLNQVVDEQQKRIDALCSKVEELELALAKANKNSSNSSMSPSSDIVKPPREKTNRRGRPKKRRRGGQPGRQRKLREPLPPERVDETFKHEMSEAEIHQLGLTPTDDYEIVQQIELLDMPIYVVEHRLRKYTMPDGKTITTKVPELQGKPIFGPRMLTMIGWMKSCGHCSYTTIATWMRDVLQIPVSRGYLSNLCTGVISESIGDARQELVKAIPHQAQLASDETGLKNNGEKRWIWCIATAIFSVFHIAKSRSRSVLEELVGDEFSGYLNFDYFSANCSFAWNYDVKAQYCWAHLIREIRFLEKHPDDEVKTWSKELLDRTRRIFSAWHRRDEMTPDGFHRSMLTHRDRFLEIVRKPPDKKEAANLAARFRIVEYYDKSGEVRSYDMSDDYFRFAQADGVEPTNNHAEQQIRHCVIDRRITQGTRSEAGQRYHERMWTAIATCRKQGRSFFEFLHASINAQLSGAPGPSLLPPK